MNSVCIVGRLTRDPEVRDAGDKPVTQLRIAYDQYGGTGYVDVAVFGKAGENSAQYLSKGRQVAVTGELRWREWQPEGTDIKRQAHSIVASRVDFLAKPNGKPKDDEPADQAEPATAADGEDDIPF
jgi:single-strand DNA-binding protein